ncbi:dTDP-4-amino-4,6-dideoxygalactose transaminase [Lishizhenia tianjinensis]|uniref:dTDP-4-amino-4,6-dideoxygalactose transaminase n=2 Tax=Lishizhenia tianjinensis TaxID=477690 RepID=A0A1I7ANU4_9FLAO|nr:dTDP-4-amino-4,6-dideoxygalactose transaminase [Lishizhenia tianjinensis]
MVDLVTQYENIKEEVQTSINSILEKAQFINGPDVHAFKEELEQYLGVKHVIPCANGTDALQIAMMALDLKPGDEVITPSYTYIATTEVMGLLRLKPIFVDCDPHTFNIDPEAIRKAITPNTKAIVPVHLYGQACNMEEIRAIAKEHNLFVIEDNAQAIGSDYTFADGSKVKTGTIGDIGCTSFFPSKNLGCYGDGGALCTNNDELAEKIKMIANHGQSKRYYHDRVGCNSRLDTIQAAVLRIKLRKLDEYIAARRKAAAYYDNFFAEFDQVKTPFRDEKTNHVFHQYTLQLEGVDRDGLVEHLAAKDIPAMIYYPVPAHRQKMFAELETECGDLTTTDWLTSRVISLPMHTELEEEQLAYICNSVKEFIK